MGSGQSQCEFTKVSTLSSSSPVQESPKGSGEAEMEAHTQGTSLLQGGPRAWL